MTEGRWTQSPLTLAALMIGPHSSMPAYIRADNYQVQNEPPRLLGPATRVSRASSHGFRVRRHFVVSADRSHPSHWDDVISEAITYARQSNIDELFIAAELKNWTKFREMTERLRLLPLPVNLVVVGPMSELLKRPVSAIGNATVIELQRAPLNSFELLIKRIIDIFLAGTTLIALLPLLAIVAIAIKLDSPGPIIFRQTRHGFNGKPFQILKFRTMMVSRSNKLNASTSG
jgi:putative colanic acid biosynthesis UDP-glucose lipid carrier transferase